MNRWNPVLLLLALLALGSPPSVATAAESYDNCTGFIDSLPAVISTQGTWCLRQDVVTSITGGAAITIATNNVTLDCNNFKVGGLGAGPGTFARGILAQGRVNATIRRCNVRGFFGGIVLDVEPPSGTVSSGHLVEDCRLDGNTSFGIMVRGDSSMVRRNLVIDTGGSIFNSVGLGIWVVGRVDVLDNTVSGAFAITTASTNYSVIGILANGSVGEVALGTGTVARNRVSGLFTQLAGAKTTGILSLAGVGMDGGTFIVDNEIGGNLLANSSGLKCSPLSVTRGNTINGFATAIEPGCTSAGGDVILP